MKFLPSFIASWTRLGMLSGSVCCLLSSCSILPEPATPATPTVVGTQNGTEPMTVHLPNVPISGGGGDGGYTGGGISIPGGGGGYDGGYNPGDYYPTGDGPGTGGGGGTNEPNYDPAAGYVPAVVTQTTPKDGGNYGAVLRVIDGRAQVVEATVSVDTKTKEVKHVSISLAGILWITKISSFSDPFNTRYDSNTDTYYFQVSVTKTYFDVVGNTRILHGQISPSRGTGMIYFP